MDEDGRMDGERPAVPVRHRLMGLAVAVGIGLLLPGLAGVSLLLAMLVGLFFQELCDVVRGIVSGEIQFSTPWGRFSSDRKLEEHAEEIADEVRRRHLELDQEHGTSIDARE